ncbi:DHA2 family efflux MFS transporter permease subunit [Aeromicrobium sp. SMF47]|uniref:MFS transporter n=1 Tax=Aeromicrobium yanjiei TaxID=2662028 RepID=UPI00129E876A|nr:MFS transporter [Aeromicrobium yanjiei]MRJ76564.1 DHA2 family efflux MFS transporter permease subunit [Aeromicrobium yanjiei]
MTTHPNSPAPDAPELFALRSPTGAALVTATVLASLVGFVDAYMVNVALPAIGEDLGASVSELQWVVTGYLITVAALLMLAGSLADHLGRRRMLFVGLGVMLVSSFGCAAAPTVEVLIGARLAQGVGGALVVPSSLALLNGTLRGPDRARGIGIWAGISTIGTTLGPYGGGWLVDHASWRYMFLLNVPLIVAAFVALRRVPEVDSSRRRALSPDVAGGVLAVLGLGGVVFCLTEAPVRGWADSLVLATGIAGVLCLAALLPVERRQSQPMLRTTLFRSRQFDAINATTLLLYGALAAAGYLFVLQCQLHMGYTATQAGAALIPESAVFLVVSPFVGGLVSRVGTRGPMTVGIILVAAGFCWLSAAGPGDGYVSAVLPGAILWGLGIGLTVAPLTAGVLAAVDDADLGEASAINDAVSRVGGVIMIALVPAILGAGGAATLAEPLAQRYQLAMLVMAGLTGLAAAISAVFIPHERAPSVQPVAAAPRVSACAVPEPSVVRRRADPTHRPVFHRSARGKGAAS